MFGDTQRKMRQDGETPRISGGGDDAEHPAVTGVFTTHYFEYQDLGTHFAWCVFDGNLCFFYLDPQTTPKKRWPQDDEAGSLFRGS